MKGKKSNRWNTYEPFAAKLAGKHIADLIVTGHAQSRWGERVMDKQAKLEEVNLFLMKKLEDERIKPSDRNEPTLFIIDDDVQMVAEFELMDENELQTGLSTYKMIVVTFLERLSVNNEYRDINS
ncbi:hypothetical protein [Paenibacillus aceris]|uniref:Uncharacterized protein YacL (UPF0231 family) n=1 Tax=Paenibacillus aceris TaxID=869555 RepID=A0ABS4HT97_9BACL|nr:hypothetical protein [Paenibacillus aceris]MBP1961616.1 uncharacterized protein YacL (UPF0231 family) [Paenibacillus aceris]NHW37611.1 hypothetical protein [Paenibacillus aceris]